MHKITHTDSLPPTTSPHVLSIIAAVSRAMAKLPDNAEIQASGGAAICCAMRALPFDLHVQRAGAPAVARAMRKLPDDGLIQREGVLAVSHVMQDPVLSRDEALLAAGAAAVAAAMLSLPGDAEVQRNGSIALANAMARDRTHQATSVPAVTQAIKLLGVGELVEAVVKSAHVKDVLLAALDSILAGSVMSEGTLRVVMAAPVKHAKDEDVANACVAVVVEWCFSGSSAGEGKYGKEEKAPEGKRGGGARGGGRGGRKTSERGVQIGHGDESEEPSNPSVARLVDGGILPVLASFAKVGRIGPALDALYSGCSGKRRAAVEAAGAKVKVRRRVYMYSRELHNIQCSNIQVCTQDLRHEKCFTVDALRPDTANTANTATHSHCERTS